MVNMCVCIILLFVNKQAFWRWRIPNMGIEGVELEAHVQQTADTEKGGRTYLT
jgi:hypothetical protein